VGGGQDGVGRRATRDRAARHEGGREGRRERRERLVRVARRTLYWDRVRRWWSGERGKVMRRAVVGTKGEVEVERGR